MAIYWRTIFARRAPRLEGKSGMYCFDGEQGEGKTLSAVNLLYSEAKKAPVRIYTNIDLYDFPVNAEIIKYKSAHVTEVLHQLNDQNDRQTYILVDEMAQLYLNGTYKNATMDAFQAVTQMRKRSIVVLATAQNFADLDTHIRRHFRYVIRCKSVMGGHHLNLWIRRRESKFDVAKDRYGGIPSGWDFLGKAKWLVNKYNTFELVSDFNEVSSKAISATLAGPVAPEKGFST